MILNNLTRKTTLSSNLKEAKSTSDKILGLLKQSNPRSLLIRTRFGIHTFFLNKPIDVIVLSNISRIAIATTVKPNNIFIYSPKYSQVIELPEGTIARSKTKVGDRLEMKGNL